MTAQAIGFAAATLAFLCVCGLACWRLLPPSGKHAPGGRHRDDGHPGAGSPGHANELDTLRIQLAAARRHRDEDEVTR